MINEGFRNRLDAITKLDNKRWQSSKNPSYFSESENLTADQKILAHWLTYITDRIVGAERIWKEGYPIFSLWVSQYSTQNEIYNLFRDGSFCGLGREFKSRFPNDDFQRIKRTLELLKGYDRSLTCFVVKQVERFSDDSKLLRKIACCLYLLTYERKISIDDTKNMFLDSWDLKEYYEVWENQSRKNKKRLWAAFRDYIKAGSEWQKFFVKALKDRESKINLIQLWESFGNDFQYLNQLELPGDIWNENAKFTRLFLAPLAIQLEIDFKIQDVPEVARNICEKLKDLYGIKFFPEQLDFIWEPELRKKFFSEFENQKISLYFE